MDSEILKFAMLPIVGGIIGLVTNWFAIKMLFHPYKELKVFGIKLPFTPGVIPKEHKRLADKIGDTVGTHLVTAESLHELFKSEEVLTKIDNALDNMYSNFGVLQAFLTPDIKQMITKNLISMLDREMPDILNSLDIKKIVSEKVENFSLKKLEEIILSVTKTQLSYITYFGGLLGFFIGLVQIIILL